MWSSRSLKHISNFNFNLMWKHVPNIWHPARRSAELGGELTFRYQLPIKFSGSVRSNAASCKTCSLNKNQSKFSMNPKGNSSTSFTKGSCPARRAGAGSADVVAGSSVLALTAGLTARAKAPLRTPCNTGITTRWWVNARADQGSMGNFYTRGKSDNFPKN